MGVKRRPPRRSTGSRSGGPSATATKAVLIGFERWYARHLTLDGAGHPSTEETVALLAELFDRSRGALHAPVAPLLADLLAAYDDDPSLAPQLPAVIQTLEHYLDFAVESGSWPGTEDEIDESSELLELAFEVSTELLGFLVDSLDEVDDVPEAQERAAFAALPAAIRTPDELLERLRVVVGVEDPTPPDELAVERVIGLLCVAAAPGLLPERSEERIRAMLDTAAGVTAEEAQAADPDTMRMLELLERDGLIRRASDSGVARYQTPAGLRPALADAVVEVAEELGLVDDAVNPHPPGTALQVQIAVVGAQPAQWRRLLLAADSDLGELHLATQLSLDWANDESHAFALADEPGVLFTSVERIGGADDSGGVRGLRGGAAEPWVARSGREDVIDENEVQLGELLGEPGDEIRYRYGDDQPREVIIRLEEAVDADGRALPRAIGATAEIEPAEVDGLLTPLRLR